MNVSVKMNTLVLIEMEGRGNIITIHEINKIQGMKLCIFMRDGMVRLGWSRDVQNTWRTIGEQDGSTENGILKAMVRISVIKFGNGSNYLLYSWITIFLKFSLFLSRDRKEIKRETHMKLKRRGSTLTWL
jgi:hypothetical protein